MKSWGIILLTLLLAACGQTTQPQPSSIAAAPTVAPATATSVPTATAVPPTATPVPTETPAPTDTPQPTATQPPEPTATNTPQPTATSAPKFTLSAHAGGRPAQAWDKSNWDAFLSSYSDLNTATAPTDYYGDFINRAVYNKIMQDSHPDVFSVPMGGHLRIFAEQGVIADISDLWQSEGWDETFPASVKTMATVNGRQYFVPQAIQWNGIFLRSDVMEAAGVKPPTTWDELLAACDALRAADVMPFVATATASWPPPIGFWFTHINQRLNGPDFHEQLMRGEVAYTDVRVRNVFDHYAQLFEHNCFDEAGTSIGYGQAISKYQSGDAAMYAHGEWLYEFISDDTKAVTDFMRFPIIDESVPLGEIVPMFGAFMLADTEYPEEARAYLKFVAGFDSQQSNTDTLRRLPSNLNVDRSELLPVYEKGLQMVEEAEVLTQLIGANTDPVVAASLLGTISRFWQDQADIDAALESIEEDRQAVYGDIASE